MTKARVTGILAALFALTVSGCALKPPKPGDVIPSRDGMRNYTICGLSSPPDCTTPTSPSPGVLQCARGTCTNVSPNCKCELFSSSYKRAKIGPDGPWEEESQPAVDDGIRHYDCFCAR